jgi:hypothetical protein
MVKFLLIVCLFLQGGFVQSKLVANVLQNIEASQVDFDGKKIRLAGDVHINHQFGEIRCEKGVLLLDEQRVQDKKHMPSRILLSGSVEIKLKDGSVLTSDEADIDCKNLEGVFSSTPPNKVTYLTLFLEQGKTVPVKALSRAMRVLMKKSDGPKSEYVVSDVQGIGAVSVQYQNNLTEEVKSP